MRFGPQRSLNAPMVGVEIGISVRTRIRDAATTGTGPSVLEKRRFRGAQNAMRSERARGPPTRYNASSTDKYLL